MGGEQDGSARGGWGATWRGVQIRWIDGTRRNRGIGCELAAKRAEEDREISVGDGDSSHVDEDAESGEESVRACRSPGVPRKHGGGRVCTRTHPHSQVFARGGAQPGAVETVGERGGQGGWEGSVVPKREQEVAGHVGDASPRRCRRWERLRIRLRVIAVHRARLVVQSLSPLQPLRRVPMQSLSRLSHIPSSLARSRKLDSSLPRSNPSDPPSSHAPDTTLHLHRAPLAQIDQQRFTATPPDILSSTGSPSASSLALALAPADAAPALSIPSCAPSNPTMPRRASYTSEDGLFPSGSSQSSAHRRLSQTRVSPTAPYPPSKPTRRPQHAHSQSSSSLASNRRGSLPTLHLHTPPQATTPTLSISPPAMQEKSENTNDDDYYAHSSLATFSFGAASAPRQSYDTDMSSPLSAQATSESGHSLGTGSTDRTPRPSISHARGSDGDEDEDATRRSRAKMRAIDDGGRRPSLPTNLYTSNRPGAQPPSDDVAGPSPRPYTDAPGSDSDPTTSGNVSEADIDPGNESGFVDTDVEFDGIVPDDASQHTFGLEKVRSPYFSDSEAESDCEPGTQQYADYYIVDPNERRQEAGSPVIFASTNSEDDDSDVSETGSRGLAAIRRNSIAIRAASIRDRGFDASGDAGVRGREREDSTVTVRRPSHSTLEEVRVAAAAIQEEGQPPLPRPDWSMFPNNAGPPPAQETGEDVYSGMDLGYILDVSAGAGADSRRSSHSFIAPQALPLPPSKDKTKSKDKEKRKKDKGKTKEHMDLVVQDLVGASLSGVPNLFDVAPWATADDAAKVDLRRPSTVTLDDSFAGGLRRDDPEYAVRRTAWSFIRGPAPHIVPPRETGGVPKVWDVWRSTQIGQIRIERAVLPSSDPTKPDQQRLNVVHDVDRESGNTFGGPTTIVHRHSRAMAFSLYRYYGLRYRRPQLGTRSSTTTAGSRGTRGGAPGGSADGSTVLLPPSNAILLATKRVQEQFTTTKSTSKLDAHGLLPEEGSERREGGRREGRREHAHARRALPERQPAVPRHIIDPSRLDELDSPVATTSASNSSHTVTSSFDLSGTTATVSSGSAGHSISSITTPSTSSVSSSISLSERQLSPPDEAEEDSDGEFGNPVQRRTHAEAFDTLDSYAIDKIKNERTAPLPARRSPGWLQRIISPAGGGSGSGTQRSLSSLAPIQPPWMTLAPRSMQEEQDRVIQGLSSSFKDVGLLPSGRPKGGAGIGRKGKSKNKDVLTHVPDESLYMLLPLWPHETDPAHTVQSPEPSPRELNREQNLYLLVYYVAFEERGESKDAPGSGGATPAKKRSRSRPRKGERERQHTPQQSAPPLFDAQRGFKVVGRLVAHSDLNGSGIRLPVRGLAVTGSLAEAERSIPPASLRDVHSDDFVIGMCIDRSGRSIEFVPEGLEKLGLCVPRAQPLPAVPLHTHPGMQTADPVDEEVEPQPLTAIGRAAVEIAWLGCMALTTYYGPDSSHA